MSSATVRPFIETTSGMLNGIGPYVHRRVAVEQVARELGWTVVRFSGRRIAHRLDECVGEVIDLLIPASAEGLN